ncbi:MAG: hypothetical protein AAB800_04000 [Patescibacteria group bacterium]
MPIENALLIDNRNCLAPDVRVHRVKDLDFISDFPMFRDSSVNKIFAQIVSHEGNPCRYVHSGWFTARAGSIIPPLVFSYQNNPSASFTDIYGKGIGITNWDVAIMQATGRSSLNWEDNGRSPFLYGNKPNGSLGVVTLDDSRSDAEGSRQIDALGIRSRLPIVVYAIDELKINGAFVAVEELRGTHFPLNPNIIPTISIWARRYPYNFQDLEEYLISASSVSYNGERAARIVIDSIMTYLRFEKDNEAQRIVGEYFGLKQKGYNGALLYLTELKLFDWIAKKYARQMNIMNEHGIYHENLSVHNMSPLVEFSDNSHVIIRGKEEWVKSPGDHSKNREDAINNINRFVKAIENARGSDGILTGRNLYRTYIDEYALGKK